MRATSVTPRRQLPLSPLTFDREPVGAEDVRLKITFYGVCHSDVHRARDEFGGALATNFLCTPGHGIVAKVTEIGSVTTKCSRSLNDHPRRGQPASAAQFSAKG